MDNLKIWDSLPDNFKLKVLEIYNHNLEQNLKYKDRYSKGCLETIEKIFGLEAITQEPISFIMANIKNSDYYKNHFIKDILTEIDGDDILVKFIDNNDNKTETKINKNRLLSILSKSNIKQDNENIDNISCLKYT